jgi:hypothetical protein
MLVSALVSVACGFDLPLHFLYSSKFSRTFALRLVLSTNGLLTHQPMNARIHGRAHECGYLGAGAIWLPLLQASAGTL